MKDISQFSRLQVYFPQLSSSNYQQKLRILLSQIVDVINNSGILIVKFNNNLLY